MKRIFIILLITVLFSSCSLLYQLISKAPVDGNIYVMDWEKEAVYKLDSLYNSELLFSTGTAPSDLIIDGEYFIVSNSGFGGSPSIDKYNMDGQKVDSFLPAGNSSPANLTSDDQYLYIALWGSGEVLVLDKDNMTEITRISVPSAWSVLSVDGILYIGTSPFADPCQYLYTASIDDWSMDSIAVGNNPSYLANDGARVYVACQGNAISAIKGSLYRIENEEVAESRELDSYPGRMEMTNEGLFVTNGFYSDSVYQSNVLLIDSEDLSTLQTYDIVSASDIEQYNDKMIVGTNSGEIYVIELSALTQFISTDTDMNLKTGKIAVK